jgi:hypothetical protein
MKISLIAALAAATLIAAIGCSISHGTTEQRIVELPKGHPETSLQTAQQICQQVASGGIAAKVHERFPSLTEQQLRGIVLRPMSGNFPQGGQSTFIMTGLYYEGSLPEAKQIADYIESEVRAAVVARLGSAGPSSSP